MKKQLMVAALVVLAACSRNPDPEYGPGEGDVVPGNAPAEAEASAAAPEAAAPAAVAPAPAAATPSVSEERAMQLGREAVAMLNENRIAELWGRFDAQMKTALGSQEAFEQMVAGMAQQLGPETEVVSEDVGVPDEAPALTYYRRRARYMLMSQMTLDMYVVFNADESIAGLTARPSEE